MKERPIIFSSPMVRAILEGRKSMTRRPVKPQPSPDCTPYHASGSSIDGNDWKWISRPLANVGVARSGWFKCPYGIPKDKLWVRETWGYTWECDANIIWNKTKYLYKADESYSPNKWRPSIFMPRWASRLTLEITDIRVERLQEITEEDARKEGVRSFIYDGAGVWQDYGLGEGTWCNSARSSFGSLWTSINGKGSWEKNPWVWVISFKKI